MNDIDRSSFPLSVCADHENDLPLISDGITKRQLNDILRLQHEQMESIRQVQAQVGELSQKISGQCKSFFTVNEIASLLDREPGTVRRWIRKGKLRAQRVRETGPRGQWLVSCDALKELLDSGFDAQIPGINAPEADGDDAAQPPPAANRIAGSTEQGAA